MNTLAADLDSMKLAVVLFAASALGLHDVNVSLRSHSSLGAASARSTGSPVQGTNSVNAICALGSMGRSETPEERGERKRLEERLKAEAEQARTALKAALSKPEKKSRMEALAKHGRLADAKLVKLVAGALDDREQEVIEAALEALRYNPHKDALAVLHKTWRRNKKMRKDAELGPKLIKSIGQHGSESSLEMLTDGIFLDEDDKELAQARVLSLGNIRTRESVEAMLDLMNSSQERYIRRHMSNIRLSMMMLTGTDKGDNVEAWMQWWNENKKDFEVAEKPPLLPRASQERWDRFWGIARNMPRESKREDRGK